MEKKVILDTLDKRIERLAQQVGDLMKLYRKAVKAGRLPDIWLDEIKIR